MFKIQPSYKNKNKKVHLGDHYVIKAWVVHLKAWQRKVVPHPISIMKEAMGHNSREMLVVKDKVVMDSFDEGKCKVEMLLSAVLMVAWQIDNDVDLSELAPRNEMHTRSSEVVIMEFRGSYNGGGNDDEVDKKQ